MSMERIVFHRIGGMMQTQMYPAILLQIEKHDAGIRRLLLSTPTNHYLEAFLPVKHTDEVADIEWIALVRGVNEALRMRQPTIHIQMDNANIVKALLTNKIPTDSINTKYHHRMLMDSLTKSEWVGIRALV